MASMAMVKAPPDATDEALVSAAREGDQEAFTILVARYRDVAYAYACARLRNRSEAEDVAQEAFVRAYLALGRFRASERWTAWMMRILRNLCTDTLRKSRGRRLDPLEDDYADQGPSPEMFALAKARHQELRAALLALPEKYRIPLLMHYCARRTYREIALALELPESTIVGRLAGALRLLRRRLKHDTW
jgi:RNA polymerase sigma factor (sigma-70 family)